MTCFLWCEIYFFTTNPIPAQEAVEVVQVQLMVSPLTLVG
jgi:hypothetical protein